MKFKQLTWFIYLLSLQTFTIALDYDLFDCNHYGNFTVGVCYQLSGSLQMSFKCNSSDTMTVYLYQDGCDEFDINPDGYFEQYEIYKSDDTSNIMQCDKSNACDYGISRHYIDEEDCNGNYTSSIYNDTDYFIINQCYRVSDSITYEYRCVNSGVYKDTYESPDCDFSDSGFVTVRGYNYGDRNYHPNKTGCYEVCCNFVYICMHTIFFCFFFLSVHAIATNDKSVLGNLQGVG